MRCRKAAKATAASAARDLPELDRLGGTINSTAYRSYGKTQVTIRAKLVGSDICTAEGHTAHGAAPILSLCRKLIEADVDPDRPYSDVLTLIVAIGVASKGAAPSFLESRLSDARRGGVAGAPRPPSGYYARVSDTATDTPDRTTAA
jgi:hypothetical protein